MLKRYSARSAFSICLIFAVLYSVLSVVRHLHFGSYGFDLGITDQVVWLYSRFQSPITTVQAYPFTSILTDHVEFIYILLAPFYWIYRNPVTLLVLQAVALSFSGMPIYLLARKRSLMPALSFAILVSYLLFFGIQNAIWSDVHSISFGAAALSWFVYFLDTRNAVWTVVTVVLALLCKEDMAVLTALVGLVYVVKRRDRLSLSIVIISFMYLGIIFGIYFPYFTRDGYRYASSAGLGTHLGVTALFDTPDKRSTWLYALAWFGFLPLLSPFALIPAVGDLAHYFVLAPMLTAAQGIFMQYRVTLGVLLVVPVIDTIGRWKKFNSVPMAIYLIVCALALQYVLHLPISYLTKRWFWAESKSVTDIQAMIASIPSDASVVSQNNITPHMSERRLIFTLYPTTKDFVTNSPCGVKNCDWFRWAGNPAYLIVDTSTDWDERSFLVPRTQFIAGLTNMRQNGNIMLLHRSYEASVYRVIRNP